MGTPYLGELKIISLNYPPKGWAFAQRPVPADQPESGAVLAARHDLWRQRPDHLRPAGLARPSADPRGRRAHTSARRAAQEVHTLTMPEMPAHTPLRAGANSSNAGNADRGRAISSRRQRASTHRGQRPDDLLPATVTNVGGSQPHENRAAFSGAEFLIALQGIFPSQN